MNSTLPEITTGWRNELKRILSPQICFELYINPNLYIVSLPVQHGQTIISNTYPLTAIIPDPRSIYTVTNCSISTLKGHLSTDACESPN